MPWGPAPVTTLIAPEDAGPDDPSIIIFPDPIPAELVAFYAGDTVVHCMLFQQSSSDYVYFAFIDPAIGRSFLAIGGMESVGMVVTEVAKIRIGTIGINTSLTVADLRISDAGWFSIDGLSAPRGFIDRVTSAANTGAIGAETITLTGNSVLYRNGRAFLARVRQHVHGSIANQAQIRVKQTNLAGVTLLVKRTAVLTAALGTAEVCDVDNVFVNTRGSDFTGVVVASLTAQGGGTVTGVAVAAAEPRQLDVIDIGAATEWAGAPSLV